MNQPVRAEQVGQFLNLSFRSLVAPDERGPHDFVAGIEQDGAMHLSREADALNRSATLAEKLQRLLYGATAGAPPIPGILFRPSYVRRLKRRMLLGAGRNYLPALVDNQSARSARAHIDAEEVNKRLLFCRKDFLVEDSRSLSSSQRFVEEPFRAVQPLKGH